MNKKIIGLALCGLVSTGTISSVLQTDHIAYAKEKSSISTENKISNNDNVNTNMDYMDFVKDLDPSISENNDGYYIKNSEAIKTYINKNYSKLQDIEQFKNYSKDDIYNHVVQTIKASNLNYVKNGPTFRSGAIPSGYSKFATNHYTKNFWWGVSHYMANKSAITAYASKLSTYAAKGALISLATAGILCIPSGAIGLASGYLAVLSSDLNEQALSFDRIFLDVPRTFVPYKIYKG